MSVSLEARISNISSEVYVDDGSSTHLIETTGEPGHDYYPDEVNGWLIDIRG